MRHSPLRLLLAVVAIMIAPVGVNAAEPVAAKYWVFIGTSTLGKGAMTSKGIYRSQFDERTGQLSEPELAAEVVNPTFLAVHPNKKFLYSVGEVDAVGGQKGGGVYAFAIDGATGQLTPLNSASSVGSGPCHVIVNPTGTLLTVANYGSGSTVLYKLDPDGKIGARAGFVQHTGSGKDPARQKEPHAHSGAFTKSGQFSLTADLGIDKVKVFQLDPATGAVNDEAAADITMPPGSGPRHIALTPDESFAYICGELDSTVNVVKLDLAGGKSEVVQSLSTLPQPTRKNTTAEVLLAPSGKFVYVSNRGHNSIAVFKVGADHKLTPAGYITGDIKTPRNFNLDPSGKWMLIASQEGGQVGVWELDPTTGLGKETGKSIKVGKPMCVKFVPVAK